MSEHDAQAFKRLVNDFEIPIHQFLGGDPFFAGLQGNRHPVLVGSADQKCVFALGFEVTMVHIRGQVASGQMANMDRTVRIRQRSGE